MFFSNMKFHGLYTKLFICSILIYFFICCFDCRKNPYKNSQNNIKRTKKNQNVSKQSHKSFPAIAKAVHNWNKSSTHYVVKENDTNIEESNDNERETNADIQTNAIEDMVEQFKEWKHHNYVEMTWFLNFYNKSCGTMAHLYSIGTSVQNRELWVMALGKNPHKHTPGIPEVKFVANIHGNEIAGREILLYTIKYICENINKDAEFRYLLSRIRLHIFPSLNPDGYETSQKKGKGEKFVGRLNSNGVDINRNFPDQFFPSYHDLEPETVAVMEWIKKIPFVLSASYHDGAIAVSYPFDDSPSGQTKYSATPDDDIFRRISIVYAENHPTIHQGASKDCLNAQSKRFVGGVTNGAEWSSLTNTMQDYNYIFSNCFEITVHLSCNRNITTNQLSEMFNENLKSMKEFIKQSLKGLKGFVKNEEGEPISGVKIGINDRKHDISTSNDGDFWRLLLPGTYQLIVHHKDYITFEKVITVDFDEAKFINITLSLKQADMALLKLGHVGLMKKISNIMMYESDGRDFDDSTGPGLNNENLLENKNDMESRFDGSIANTPLEINKVNIGGNQNNSPAMMITAGMPININSLENTTKTNENEDTSPKINDNANGNNSSDKMVIGVSLLCKVPGKESGIEGKMRWMGVIPALSKDPKAEPPLIVGLELYKDDELATSGEFLGVHYFKTKPKRAYFVSAKLCDIKS